MSAHAPNVPPLEAESMANEARMRRVVGADLVYDRPWAGDEFQVFAGYAIVGHTSANHEPRIEAERPVAVISLTPQNVHIEPVISRWRIWCSFTVALGLGLACLRRRR